MAADGPRLRKGYITFGVAILVVLAPFTGVASESESLAHRRSRGRSLQQASIDLIDDELTAISSTDTYVYSDSNYVQSLAGNETSRFPYCKCKTYDCECSPYTVSLSSATQSSNGSRYCFKLNYIGCADPVKPCCRALELNLEKIAFTT
ncbi:hypothetical protein Vafri_21908, partial [Volvox africanus]